VHEAAEATDASPDVGGTPTAGVGNVHALEDAGAAAEFRAARMESPTNLRVEPVVGPYRLRRRR